MENTSRVLKLLPLLNELEKRFKVLTIVETGTIRNIKNRYHIGDGHSTYYIAKWISEGRYKHNFYSIDLEIKVAEQYLIKQKLLKYVNLVKSDSIKFLSKLRKPIHFAYLDSVNNAEHVYKEFCFVLPNMVENGIIVIDDAIPESKKVVKVHKILPHLDKFNIDYQIQNKYCIVRL